MSASNQEKDSLVKTITQGTIYITAAKLYFIVSSYAIYFALPRLISSELFGIYGFVISIVSIINVVLVTGTQQTVSKFVSEDFRKADSIKKQALKLQTIIASTITLVYFFSAPLIANIFNDPALIRPLQISALIPMFYSLYAVYVGYLNGQRKFLPQAILDCTYSTLKAAGIIILALITSSVNGAIFGFGVAVIIAFLLAPFVSGQSTNQEKGKISVTTFLKFQSELLGAILVSNLLQRADLILIKKYISTDSVIANQMAGYYTALMTIAGVTYQAIVSVAFIIFPIISKASFEQQKDEVKSYIRQITKYTFMLMALSATVFSSNARVVLEVLYNKEYTIGAEALTIAAYGLMFFGLIYILTTIISSSGKPRISLIVAVITLAFSISINILLISATTIAMFIGVLLASIYIYLIFKACFNLKSVISVSIAVICMYLVNNILPDTLINLFPGKLNIIINLMFHIGIQTSSYLIALIITRELTSYEFNLIRKVIKV
ncbi:MAG: membrane protein involved in the export of O-antigen and teichoic acid [bacterium]|nr:MAG: membrane protein involved in the export of O-antigen and teichoic acid [bacterium]